MNKGKKRDRNVNFSVEETELLLSLVDVRKSIIENKKSDAVTWQDKDKAWKAIETDFKYSGVSGVFRDAKHLKLKYEALKRDIRKKISAYRTMCNSSDVVPLLTPLEEKVMNLMAVEIDADDSVQDSDRPELRGSECHFNGPETTPPVEIRDEVVAKLEVQHSDSEDSNTIDEPLSKKSCPDPEARRPQAPEVPSLNNGDSGHQQKWAEWRPAPAWTKPQEDGRPFDSLAEEKMQVLSIQKQLLAEEIEERRLKKQILVEELDHNRRMHTLQNQEMLLKIKLLNAKLSNSQRNHFENNTS